MANASHNNSTWTSITNCINHADLDHIYFVEDVFLTVVVIPILIILLKDFGIFSKLFRTTKYYWIWDTISLHCRKGLNYYYLAFVCGYCAVYMTVIKTLEFNNSESFINVNIRNWILWINLFSYQMLLGIGILKTHPHPAKQSQKIKAWLHLASAGLFFFLNICGNIFVLLFSKIKFYELNYKSKIDNLLTIASLILCVCVVITSTINIWFLSSRSPIPTLEEWRSNQGFRGYVARFLVVPILENQSWCVLSPSSYGPLPENQLRDVGRLARGDERRGERRQEDEAETRGADECNCLQRRKIYRLCALNYFLELLLIMCTAGANVVHRRVHEHAIAQLQEAKHAQSINMKIFA